MAAQQFTKHVPLACSSASTFLLRARSTLPTSSMSPSRLPQRRRDSRYLTRGYASEGNKGEKTTSRWELELDKMDEAIAKQREFKPPKGHKPTKIELPILTTKIPRSKNQKYPPGTGLGERYEIWRSEVNTSLNVLYARFVQRKNFGYPKKFKAFLSEASQTYEKLNTAIASDDFSLVRHNVSTPFMNVLKGRRKGQFPPNTLVSWRLHKDVTPAKVVNTCIHGEDSSTAIAQVAVKFETLQSLEFRDAATGKVLRGNHDEPKKVIQYYVYQKELDLEDEPWQVVGEVYENPYQPSRVKVPAESEDAQLAP